MDGGVEKCRTGGKASASLSVEQFVSSMFPLIDLEKVRLLSAAVFLFYSIQVLVPFLLLIKMEMN